MIHGVSFTGIRDDPVEVLNGEALVETVQEAFNEYQQEDDSYESAELCDVLVVGSVVDQARLFDAYKSDLDLVIPVHNVDEPGTIHEGFANYLREVYGQTLKCRSGLPITDVDIGVYDVEALEQRVEDSFVFSSTRRQVLPVSEFLD